MDGDYNSADEELLSREEFFDKFKKGEDKTFEFLGLKFSSTEVAQAKDFYAQCEDLGVFCLPRSELVNFLDFDEVKQNYGARLVLAIIIDEDGIGHFLLNEEDERILGVCRKRLVNEKYNLDLDSPLILPS